MTDIDRLYHKIKDRWGIRRTQVDATVKELEFLVQLLDMMEDDEFGKDNNVPCGGWVSVKDRLPEVGVDVLTASKTECESYYMVDCIVNGDWWLQAGEEVLPVTHWMPLPAPPKEESNDRNED